MKTTDVCALHFFMIKHFFPDNQRYGYGSGLSSFNVLKTFNWSSYFLANGRNHFIVFLHLISPSVKTVRFRCVTTGYWSRNGYRNIFLIFKRSLF